MKIFLLGFMGSGKSYWGKIWAQKTGWPFFDLDEWIEQEEKKTIVQIFEQNGEAYFRQKETQLLHSFLHKDNCIIACGGGTPCFNNNMQWMNKNGTTLYLKATAQDIFKRIITEQDKRPLIKNLEPHELLIFIKNKLKEREPFYKEAKITLPVKTIFPNSLNLILKDE